MESNQNIHQTISNLDPGDPRKVVYDSSKQFKSKWVELGKHLTKVAGEMLFKTWGYKNFEEYCQVELRLKKNTAMKLTNAYFFLQEYEPEAFKSEKVPALDSVAVLRKAKGNENVTEESYSEMREIVFDKGQAPSTVAKKYNDLARTLDGKNPDVGKALKHLIHLRRAILPITTLPEKFGEQLGEFEQYLSSLEN